MASNQIPRTFEALVGIAEDAADGLDQYQDEVGVKQNRANLVRADLAAMQEAENEFQAKRSIRKLAGTAQRLADDEGRDFIMRGKNVLEPHLGYNWSQAWAPVGFVSPSLAIPSTLDARLALVGSMRLYLANNPVYQNPPLNVTSVAAEAVYQDISTKRSATNAATDEAEAAKAVRDDKARALGRRLSGLVAELGQLLSPDDTRWYAFGFNRPIDPETPEAPEELVITPAYQGHSVANWDPARRAERYRVWRQIDGQEDDFQPILSVEDPQAVLNSVPSGQKVRYYVTAANDAGESQPSNVAEIVVP